MCFVLGPVPNRSVKEFDVELSLRISTSLGTPRSMYMDLTHSPTRPPLTTVYKLRFYYVQGCQALQCGTSFHSVVTLLSNQNRRVFLEKGSPTKCLRRL